MLLILIGLLPIKSGWFEKIQNNVTASKSYNIIYQLIDSKLPATSDDINNLTTIFEDPAKLEKLRSTKEYKTFMEDDNLKEIFSDEETVEQISNKEYGKLLANPKILSMFQNEQLLKKIFALNKKMMEQGLSDDASGKTTKRQPKMINIK